jgi:hypothetical protein
MEQRDGWEPETQQTILIRWLYQVKTSSKLLRIKMAVN